MKNWQDSRTIEYVQKEDEWTVYKRELLLSCSVGLNIGFIIALLFL